MSKFETLENGKNIILDIHLHGKIYYISEESNIYYKEDKYVLVTDEKVIKTINNIIYPPSRDVIFKKGDINGV